MDSTYMIRSAYGRYQPMSIITGWQIRHSLLSGQRFFYKIQMTVEFISSFYSLMIDILVQLGVVHIIMDKYTKVVNE